MGVFFGGNWFLVCVVVGGAQEQTRGICFPPLFYLVKIRLSLHFRLRWIQKRSSIFIGEESFSYQGFLVLPAVFSIPITGELGAPRIYEVNK